MNLKKSTFCFLAIAVCALSVGSTMLYLNLGHVNDEDKALMISLNKSTEQCERHYTYSRTYVLKDGTVIKGAGGSGTGMLKE